MFLEIFVVIILLVYVFFRKRYAYWANLNVPFEEPTFIVGNVGKAITLRSSISEICCNIYANHVQHRYVGFFDMWKPAVVIRDPEIINNILIKEFKSYRPWIEVKECVDPILCANPFVLYGEKWKAVRMNMTSQFTSTKIKTMIPQIVSINNKMVEYIKKHENKDQVCTMNVQDLASRFTGDNVYSCAFGLDGRSFVEKYPEPMRIADQICSNSKLVQLKQTISVFFPQFSRIFDATFLGDPVSTMFKDMILASVKYRNSGLIVKKDFLNHLMELKNKSLPYHASDENLICQAFTFYLDGYETSGLTFTYALFELARNPDIQDKAREEVELVLQKYDNEITYETLQELQYVENVVLETVRKYPIIKFMARVCLEDVVFPSSTIGVDDQNVMIKKGTEVFIPVEAVHNDPKYYPNPKNFDPDRFKEDVKNLRPPNTYLGFGNGPKLCLGRPFALAQIKLGLTVILSQFRLEFNEITEMPLEQRNIHLFMSPKSEIWLNIISRS